jgi:hypothetical protein
MSVAIGAIGPVVKEFYFRGMVYRYGRDAAIRFGRRPAIIVGLVITAVLFMTIHDGFAWAYILQGLGFALLYEFTGTLQAPSFAHALNNSWVVATTAMAAQGFATWVYVLAALCPVRPRRGTPGGHLSVLGHGFMSTGGCRPRKFGGERRYAAGRLGGEHAAYRVVMVTTTEGGPTCRSRSRA